jgi:poly-gamma-glutamate synthesis protein (capsule biosynthesis protein)
MVRRLALLSALSSVLLFSCGRGAANPTYSIAINQGAPPGLIEALAPVVTALVETAAAPLGMTHRLDGDAPIQVLVEIRHGSRAGGFPEDGGNKAAWDTALVPIAEFDSGTPEANLAECLDGTLRLSLPDRIPAGYVARLVDGLAFDDTEYALGARILIDVRRNGRTGRRPASLLSDELGRSMAEMTGPPPLRWLAAAGDMMLGRGAAGLLARDGSAALMGGAAAILHEADAAVVNLEGVVTDRGTKAFKAYTFRYDPSVAPMLAKVGIDAVLVSNNHALDWGMAGFTDMLKVLERAGIGALGGGPDLEAASAAYEAKGFRLYGLSSYPRELSGWDGRMHAAGAGSPGIMRAEGCGTARLAEGFRDGVVDAVFVHGGTEWSTAPDMATRELFHALVDAGADAVFGSHPHVAQAVELYKGRPIFWSLGNFVFQGMQGTPGGQKGLLGLVGFLGERAVYIRSIPLLLDGERVDIAP